MSESAKWLLLAVAVAAGVLIYLLAPVLTPFLAAALLAYLGDPLVLCLQRLRLTRTQAVILVFVLLMLMILGLMLVLVPAVARQVAALLQLLPAALEWMQSHLLPRLAALPGVDETLLDPQALRAALDGHWQQWGGVLGGLWDRIAQSGQSLLAGLAYALLIPVVTFYLLRDWPQLIARTHELLPRTWEPTVVQLSRDCDRVLGEFLRGQLLVMLALGVFYSLGLWLVGLDLALAIGMLAGLVSFVPYLGVIVGVGVAGLAALLQFGDVLHLLLVLAVFGLGQALEGLVLSPWLVGERIGLHPVAVIFAVMAGGQLFGFFGVLVALPAAAVVVVLLRHARARYLASGLYAP